MLATSYFSQSSYPQMIALFLSSQINCKVVYSCLRDVNQLRWLHAAGFRKTFEVVGFLEDL